MASAHRRSTGVIAGMPCSGRDRRLSAPTSSTDADHLQQQAYVTKASTALRTFASAISKRIRTLPEGCRVIQAMSPGDSEQPGWIKIVPQGFVREDDLQKLAEPEPCEALALPRVSRQRRSRILDELEDLCDKDDALNKKGTLLDEIESLQEQRDLLYKEVVELQRTREVEEEEIRILSHQEDSLRHKLEKCREAVAMTVDSIDAFYTVSSEEQPEMNTMLDAQARVKDAGEVVAGLLSRFDEVENETDEDIKGADDDYDASDQETADTQLRSFEGKENVETSKDKISDKICSREVIERVPFGIRNA